MTRNPWLEIPAADYLGHMDSPEVDQLSVLGRLFGEALRHARPAKVLLLGCATGNGLDRIDASVTRHVTGVDINPEYLDRLRAAFPSPAFDLQLECADLMTRRFDAGAFDLVHGALLFEYLDWPRLVPAIARTLRPGGSLSVVLQRPSPTLPAITQTNYQSLRLLESVFQLVDPAAVVRLAREVGLDLRAQRTEPLPSGKAFEMLMFGS